MFGLSNLWDKLRPRAKQKKGESYRLQQLRSHADVCLRVCCVSFDQLLFCSSHKTGDWFQKVTTTNECIMTVILPYQTWNGVNHCAFIWLMLAQCMAIISILGATSPLMKASELLFTHSTDSVTNMIQVMPLGNEVEMSVVMNDNDTTSSCFVHSVRYLNLPFMTEPRTANQTMYICGQLTRDWTYNPPLSDLARMFHTHQSNCSLPEGQHPMVNNSGIGSNLNLWSMGLYGAMERGLRIRTHRPDWQWLHQEYCDMEEANLISPLLCYLPNAEYHCPTSDPSHFDYFLENPMTNRTLRSSQSHEWYAASTEYLFQRVSPIIIQEAQRQVGIVFHHHGGINNGTENDDKDNDNGISAQQKAIIVKAPHDLVTVHIRWGDKGREMKRVSIAEYVQAIDQLTSNAVTANIYIATEDPNALVEFMAFSQQERPGWKVYYDAVLKEFAGMRSNMTGNHAVKLTRATKGHSGLVSFGSLLVALEAKYFVLTGKSNWSTLINQLRTNVIDPRCGNCTKAIDLRPRTMP